MLYSRFEADRGDYAVFEDSVRHPLNGDFPVPALGPEINQIGVPASEAGRPLPRGARFVGRSWHARGLVVAPQRAGLGLTQAELGNVVVPIALIGATAIAVFWMFPKLFLQKGRE